MEETVAGTVEVVKHLRVHRVARRLSMCRHIMAWSLPDHIGHWPVYHQNILQVIVGPGYSIDKITIPEMTCMV